MQWDGDAGGYIDSPVFDQNNSVTPPVWLKMRRVGNIIYGEYSTDGVNYYDANKVGTPSFIDLSANINESVNIGIFNDGNGYAAENTLKLCKYSSFTIRDL